MDGSRIVPLILLFIGLVFGACAHHGGKPEGETIQGKLFHTGNEPFTEVGIRSEAGDSYLIKCSKDDKATLWLMVDREVLIRYSEVLNRGNQKVLVLSSFELLKDK